MPLDALSSVSLTSATTQNHFELTKYDFPMSVVKAINSPLPEKLRPHQQQLHHDLYQIKAGKLSQYQDFSDDCRINLPFIIDAENNADPQLKLELLPSVEKFITYLQTRQQNSDNANQHQHLRCIVVNNEICDGNELLRHCQYIDVSLKPASPPSIIIIEPGEADSAASQAMVTRTGEWLAASGLINRAECDKRKVISGICVIGAYAQKIAWDAAKYCLQFAKDALTHAATFQQWHQRQHQGLAAFTPDNWLYQRNNELVSFMTPEQRDRLFEVGKGGYHFISQPAPESLLALPGDSAAGIVMASPAVLPAEFIRYSHSAYVVFNQAKRQTDEHSQQRLSHKQHKYLASLVTVRQDAAEKVDVDSGFSPAIYFNFARRRAKALLTQSGQETPAALAVTVPGTDADAAAMQLIHNHYALSVKQLNQKRVPECDTLERDKAVLPELVRIENLKNPQLNLRLYPSIKAAVIDLASASRRAEKNQQPQHYRCIVADEAITEDHHIYLDVLVSGDKSPSIIVIESSHPYSTAVNKLVNKRLSSLLARSPRLQTSTISLVGTYAQKSRWDCIIYCLNFARVAFQYADFFQQCHRHQQNGEAAFTTPAENFLRWGLTDFLPTKEKTLYWQEQQKYLDRYAIQGGVNFYWPHVLPVEFYHQTASTQILKYFWKNTPQADRQGADKLLQLMAASEERTDNNDSLIDKPAAAKKRNYLPAIEYSRLDFLREAMLYGRNAQSGKKLTTD